MVDFGDGILDKVGVIWCGGYLLSFVRLLLLRFKRSKII